AQISSTVSLARMVPRVPQPVEQLDEATRSRLNSALPNCNDSPPICPQPFGTPAIPGHVSLNLRDPVRLINPRLPRDFASVSVPEAAVNEHSDLEPREH